MGPGNESTINQWLSLQASETDALSKMLIAQSPNNVAAGATAREKTSAAGSQPGLPMVVETMDGTITDGGAATAAASGGLPSDVVSPEQVQAHTSGSIVADTADERPIQTIGTNHSPSQRASPPSHPIMLTAQAGFFLSCYFAGAEKFVCAHVTALFLVSVSQQNQEEVAQAEAEEQARQAKAAADQAAFDAEQEAFRQSQMQP
jgi:hypothetical protein